MGTDGELGEFVADDDGDALGASQDVEQVDDLSLEFALHGKNPLTFVP